MPTSAEFRARARESLAGNWKHAVLHFLLYVIIISACGIFRAIPIVGWIGVWIVTGALMYGIMNFFLSISRGENPQTADLFSGFSRFVDTFILYLLSCIFIFLWSLLLIIPGIIAALRYSQAYYLLKDNPGISPLEAINRSKAMMDGHKGRLFMLLLSFIGWYLLALLTFGIGMLWLAPYAYTAFGHFHNDLLTRTNSIPLPPPPSPYEKASF